MEQQMKPIWMRSWLLDTLMTYNSLENDHAVL